MRRHTSLRRSLSAGFTLVEMAVIAPIVILLIGVFISLIVNLTGEVMSSRGSNILTYNLQDALNRIEQDVKLSTTFLSVNNINVATTKQGYGGTKTTGSTTAFTNIDKTSSGGSPASIVLNILATDGNPLSTNSGLVYLKDQPNPCSDYAEYSKNRPMSANVVYFIDSSDTLWRRVIMPENSAATPAVYCGNAPWQIPTCINGYSSGSLPFCRTNDERLVDGVSPGDFNFEYYTSASSTIPSASATNPASSDDIRNAALLSTPTLKVTLTANQTIAGRDITRTASLRTTRLDSNATSIAKDVVATSAPNAPAPSGVVSDGHIVKVTWPQTAGATSYEASYRINGGSWSGNTTALNNTTRSYTVTAGGHTDTVEVRVRATNSFGSSAYATSSTKIPLWAPLLLESGWTNYGQGYSNASYTKTKAGYVMFKGLVKKSTGAIVGERIANVPADYRQAGEAILIGTTTDSNTWGRIDIQSNGDVIMGTGSANWFSLESIRYVAAVDAYPRTNATLQNGWSNFINGWDRASYVQDSTGRVSFQGLIAGGPMTNDLPMVSMPAALGPPQYMHIPSHVAGAGFTTIGMNGVNTTPSIVAKGVGVNSYYTIVTSYMPASAGVTWSNLTLQNGWATYGGIYSTPQYTKVSDGVVHLKGLIRSGTNTDGTVIATLPAGFRPSTRLLSTVASAAGNSSHTRLDVLPNGQLIIQASDGNGWLSLDGISFVAEQ